MFRVLFINGEEILDNGIYETEAAAEAEAMKVLGDPMFEYKRAIILRPIAELAPETRIVRKPLNAMVGGSD